MQADRLSNLMEAVIEGSSQDVANALIFYEELNPTIADGVAKGVQDLRDYVSNLSTNPNKRPLHWSFESKIAEAIKIRRARLGDALWFSRF